MVKNSLVSRNFCWGGGLLGLIFADSNICNTYVVAILGLGGMEILSYLYDHFYRNKKMVYYVVFC